MCKCAADWDSRPQHYNEEWDFARRDSMERQRRTRHLRFLFEVGQRGRLVPGG